MLTHFAIPEHSKELFFKISSSLQILNFDLSSKGNKFIGLYAIYKGDTCYYAGQSKNLASRISQHLSGKYSGCTKIYLLLAKENGFDDIDDRNPQSVTSILENNEKFLINKLKPIENLLIPDSDYNLDSEKRFNCFNQEMGEDFFMQYGSSVVFVGEHYISVSDQSYPDDFTGEAFKHHNEFIISTYKSFGEEVFERGLV